MAKIFFFILFPFFLFAQTKIQPIAITTVNGLNNAQASFDGDLITGWFPGWNPSDYPAHCVVDLGDTFNITNIRVYDSYGVPTLIFKDIVSFPLDGFGVWTNHPINVNVRVIDIAIESIQGENVVPEIEFYGTPSGIVDPPDTIVVDTTVNVFATNAAAQFGMNGFDWIPMDNIFSQFRMYQILSWTWTGPNGLIKVAPTKRGDVNYDVWLTTAKSKAIETVFCPNRIPYWLAQEDPNNWGEWMDQRLHPVGANPESPLSYIEIGKYYWQIAARYGVQSHIDSDLHVDVTQSYPNEPINQKKSGLNLLRYIEIENEPDRPWKTPLYKYTPAQYACLLSVAVDGHCGLLGPLVGVKDADSTFNVIMGGMSSMDIQYLKEVNNWCVANRPDHRFPVKIIGIHHYCNVSNPPYPSTGINLFQGNGIAPEQDHLRERLTAFINWCHSNLPDVKIYFSEFGYDTKPPSTQISQYPILYGNNDAEQLQKIWLTRTYLEAIAMGIDKCFMYNGIDENSASMGYCFGSSGLLTGLHPTDNSPALVPKPAYTFLKYFIKELNGYKYSNDLSTFDARVYSFVNADTTKYVYWSPTANDIEFPYTIKGQSVTVTETPKILTYNSVSTTTVPDTKLIQITPTISQADFNIVNESNQNIKIYICDLLGNIITQNVVVKPQSVYVFTLIDKPSGVYFVQIVLNGQKIVKKVIKM